MWEGIFGFFAGAIVATITLWSLVSRRAKVQLEVAEKAALQEKGLREEADQQAATAVKMAEAQAKRANEYFGTIEGVVKERTDWAERYQKMALSAGNAQDLMMRTIDSLCRQLEKAGRKVEIPGIIKAVRTEFAEHFEAPQKQGVEKDQPRT